MERQFKYNGVSTELQGSRLGFNICVAPSSVKLGVLEFTEVSDEHGYTRGQPEATRTHTWENPYLTRGNPNMHQVGSWVIRVYRSTLRFTGQPSGFVLYLL